MMVNPVVDGYTKTLKYPQNSPKITKKQHPSENQKNTKTKI